MENQRQIDIDTLSNGGKVNLGHLGYLQAEKRVFREYDFTSSEDGTTRLRKATTVVKYYPSEDLKQALA